LRYFNLHTHSSAERHSISIQNVHSSFLHVPATGYYSIGVHPWYLNEETVRDQMRELRIAIDQPNILAIGECGLDRMTTADFELQKRYFIEQIKIANDVSKPLIVHCVRAHEDALHILKKYNNRVPVLFHGYNKDLDLAEKIIAAGHYLSFGHSLLSSAINQEVFKALPLERTFLENDDSSLSIEQVYAEATRIKEVDVNLLLHQIHQTAQAVFGRNFLENE
jgi:TatD DNase family protein